MAWAPLHGPAARRAVADLMRGSDLTPKEIAERTGVPYATVCRWNLIQGWRPAVLRSREAHRPQKWSDQRVAALGRVARVPGVDPGDLAEALGARRDRAEAMFRACGLSEVIDRRSAVGRAQEEGGLRAALRAHVARQIGAFDALLCAQNRPGGRRGAGPGTGQGIGQGAEEAPPEGEGARARGGSKVGAKGSRPLDTAKILRDHVGLKKLLDELGPEPGEGFGRVAEEPSLDIVALRADIARRYAAFEAEEARAAAEGRPTEPDWEETIADPAVAAQLWGDGGGEGGPASA